MGSLGDVDDSRHAVSDAGGIRVDVLGPLRVHDARGPIELRGDRLRRLLSALALRHPAGSGDARLLDAVFAGGRVGRPEVALRTYVTRLRQALGPQGPALVLRIDGGYRLEVPAECLDVNRLTRLAEAGRRQLQRGEPDAAYHSLSEASQLWRGPAYEEYADEPWAAAEATRLESLIITVGCSPTTRSRSGSWPS